MVTRKLIKDQKSNGVPGNPRGMDRNKPISHEFGPGTAEKSIDNSRYDVYFPKDFQSAVSRAVLSFLIKHTKTESILNLSNKLLLIEDIKKFPNYAIK